MWQNREEGWIKLTQPVLLQSYVDEFDASKLTKPVTPAIPKSVLLPNQTEKLDKTKHRLYRKGVGKLLHMARYTRPDILNAVRELTQYCSAPEEHHLKAMYGS